jgi:hypothetical protein
MTSNKTKGLTLMTKEQHRFDGFAVRKARHGYSFTKYVSASQRKYPKLMLRTRQSRARIEALADLAILKGILTDPTSWWQEKELRPERRAEILDLGFTHA